MNLHISRERLRERILKEPDYEVEAGLPIRDFEVLSIFVPNDLAATRNVNVREMSLAFGSLIRLSRRRQRLSVEQLAEKVRIELGELLAIEQEHGYVPRPRTVHQLAMFLKLPEQKLMKLSGATITRDQQLQNEAVRFAAKSNSDLTKLSKQEEELLNDFVKYLSEHEDQKH